MRKTILSIIILAFTISGFAQSQIGLKVGYLMPNYKITSSPPNSRNLYNVDDGLFYSLNYKQRWPGLFNLGAEMEYHQIKSQFVMEYKSLGADVNREVCYTTNYLNFRLLPEFVYGEKFRVYFQVGPYIGFLLDSKADGWRVVSDGNGQVIIMEDGSANEFFPTIDWGIFFGGGAEYPISKHIKLALELQYSRGFAGYAQDDEYIFATQNFTTGLSFIYVFKGYAERINDKD
jgi:opacity protein-like surface antigen